MNLTENTFLSPVRPWAAASSPGTFHKLEHEQKLILKCYRGIVSDNILRTPVFCVKLCKRIRTRTR